MSTMVSLPFGTTPYLPRLGPLATFNVPTVGQYDYAIAANTNVVFKVCDPKYAYYIDRINISFSAAEEEYTEALGLSVLGVLPQVILTKQSNRQRIWPEPIIAGQYYRGHEFGTWVTFEQGGTSSDKRDAILATFVGAIGQPAAWVGMATLEMNFSATIFEVHDTTYIEKLRGLRGPQRVAL